MANTLKTSRKGLAFILAEEGIVLEAYLDAADPPVWTIGAGHTAAAGGLVPKRGMRITLEQALALFLEDVAKFEKRVNRAITVPLRQHEFDALVSFDLNTGAIKEGSVDDKLNRGDRAAALTTLKSYRKAGGRVLDGLVERRKREAAMFLAGEYFSHAVRVWDTHAGKSRAVDPDLLPWPKAAEPPQPAPLPPDLPDPIPEFRPAPAGKGGHGLALLVAAIVVAILGWLGITVEIPQ